MSDECLLIDARRGVVAWRESARSVLFCFVWVKYLSSFGGRRARTLMFAIERVDDDAE